MSSTDGPALTRQGSGLHPGLGYYPPRRGANAAGRLLASPKQRQDTPSEQLDTAGGG